MQKEQEYIYAVYQERNFSKAAKKLFISQPALSNKIKKAEEELGVTLFDRSHTPLQLTEAGRYYIDTLEQIMALEENLQQNLKHLSSHNENSITIGAATYFCSYVLPDLVRDFLSIYPDYTVRLLEGNNGDLTQCLQTGIVDLVLDVDSFDPDLFSRQYWATEELILAVPAVLPINERLKNYRQTIFQINSCNKTHSPHSHVNLKAFQNEEFLLLKKGNSAYHLALAMCHNAGFTPRISAYMDQMVTSYYVAAETKSLAFLRTGTLEHVTPTDKLFFYWINDENAVRPIYFYYKKNRILPPIAQNFLSFMMNHETHQNTVNSIL